MDQRSGPLCPVMSLPTNWVISAWLPRYNIGRRPLPRRLPAAEIQYRTPAATLAPLDAGRYPALGEGRAARGARVAGPQWRPTVPRGSTVRGRRRQAPATEPDAGAPLRAAMRRTGVARLNPRGFSRATPVTKSSRIPFFAVHGHGRRSTKRNA